MRHTSVHVNAARWVGANAQPLATFDPRAPLDDLRPLAASVRDARVVALAHSVRHSRELSAVSHRVLRLLVEEYGFRSLALEGDDPVRRGLAAYVRDGAGEPRAMLAECRSFWQTREILEVVEWMRSYNERHPRDPVRFAEPPGPEPEFTGPDSLPRIERYLAESTAWWAEQSGDRIVYWGGIAHMSVLRPDVPRRSGHRIPGRNAGALLRERLGAEYATVGLTFHHGTALHRHPQPAAGFTESVLGAAGLEAFTLGLRGAPGAGPAVRAWLDGPARVRLVGPDYDPALDTDHCLTAARLSDLLDAVVHVREITGVRSLDGTEPPAPAGSEATAAP